MPYPNLYKQTEERFGYPMEIILRRLLRHGGEKRVARWLHVHHITIAKWKRRLRIAKEYRLDESAPRKRNAA